MNLSRIIWLGLTVSVLFIFLELIPVDAYESHYILYSMLGGGLFLITLGQTLADFSGLYELFEKHDPNEPQPLGKKLAPFAIFPAFVLMIVLVFHQSSRKENELKQHGVLTKGVVLNGSSTTTTRRFRSNTTYDLTISYKDSTGREHIIEQSVNSNEFNNAYKGEIVDLVYSVKHPALGEALFSIDELTQYIKVPNSDLQFKDLVAILNINAKDSVLQFLNTISYQWTQGEEDLFVNEKRDVAVKVFPDQPEIAYIRKSNLFEVGTEEESLDAELASDSFKKDTIRQEDKPVVIYHNDQFTISKERNTSNDEGDILKQSVYTIYHVVASN